MRLEKNVRTRKEFKIISFLKGISAHLFKFILAFNSAIRMAQGGKPVRRQMRWRLDFFQVLYLRWVVLTVQKIT